MAAVPVRTPSRCELAFRVAQALCFAEVVQGVGTHLRKGTSFLRALRKNEEGEGGGIRRECVRNELRKERNMFLSRAFQIFGLLGIKLLLLPLQEFFPPCAL